MSLDCIMTSERKKMKNEIEERRRLRGGRCPHYDDCVHESKGENYYCLECRDGLIMNGKIVCYKPCNEKRSSDNKS